MPVGFGISIFGMIGNALSIIIWNNLIQRKCVGNRSTASYIIAMGICDNGLLIFFLLTDTLPTSFPHIKEHYAYAVFFSWFAFPLFFIFLVASIWLVATVTLNRLLLTVFPMHGRKFYSSKNTNISIGVVVSFATIVNIPHFFNYQAEESQGLQVTQYGSSLRSKNYEFWVHCILLVLIPWFTIATSNVLIIRKLRHQMKKFNSRKGEISNSSQQNCS